MHPKQHLESQILSVDLSTNKRMFQINFTKVSSKGHTCKLKTIFKIT